MVLNITKGAEEIKRKELINWGIKNSISTLSRREDF